MKRVCISLAAALALAVPSFAQVAQIGDKTYDSLAEFFVAFQSIPTGVPTTITLLADVEVDTQIVIPGGKDITLDLNGHTYTFNPTGDNNFYAFFLQQVNVSDPAVSLTIEDTSAEQTGTIKAIGKANACISATDAALTIHGGRFVQEGSFEYAVFATEGLVIDPAEGQTVVFPSGGVQLRRASISPYKEAGATITGGDFTGDVYYALYVGETSGGTTVNISGGTFKAGASGASVCFDVPATANISGGDFSSGKLSITTDGEGTNLIVTGGTFKEPISFADCGVGCLPIVDENGKYTVSTGNVAAIQQDDGSYVGYSNVATAIAAAEDGVTVTLLDKGALTEACTIASGKAITLDLNGQDIDLTTDAAQFTIPAGATLDVVGKGTLRNKTVNYSRGNRIFEVRGASEDNGTKAILKVGADVTLECTCGIVVFGAADTPTAAYGVEVEMAGTINNKMYAITTNGQITTTEGNVPVIKVTGKINGPNAVGIYAAGYAKWNLVATIVADDALSIKSGDFAISGGSYTSSAVYAVPPSANPSGNETTGAAISITTSDGYAQKTSVNITGGDFISKNGYALYEGIAKKADGTPAANASAVTIAISGDALFQGSDAVNTDIAITEAANKKVLSGGLFTKPVDLALCADGFFPAYVGYNSYGVQEASVTDFPIVVSTEAGSFGCKTLKDAYTASSSLGKVTFTLQQDIAGQAKQTLRNRNFDLTLDLNGHTLAFADDAYFDVTTGNLTVTGSGTLSGSTVAPIWVKGGSSSSAVNYTNVTVMGDVKVTGPSAIKLLSSSSIGYAFGATVTLKGNATCETTGAGILIDESIKKPEGNLPAVIVSENAKIVSGGVAIQGDGYATCSITGGTIQSQGALASAIHTAFAISGGTFSQAPDANLLAPGFEVVDQGNGQFIVQKQAVAAIGDVKYASLQAAFDAATATDTIKLLSSAIDTPRLTLTNGKTVTIDLNGYDIGFVQGAEGIPAGYFFVNGGALTLTGKGKVYEQGPYYGAILIKGSTEDVADYSVVDVGEDVTLEGWAPLFIDKNIDNNNAGCAYGVKVTMAGTVNSVRDTTGAAGHGVYINGSIKKTEGNVPQITLTETSKVTSIVNGIYAAGYAHWTLAGDVSGADALSIKCGTFDIQGGSYTAKGPFADPADANGNGSENTGAAVSITTNSAYAPKTNVTITGGTFISENGYAFYEGIAKKADGTLAAEASTAVIAIQGGTFVGNAEKGSIMIATAKDKQVITGGYFSMMPPNEFLADGVISIKDTAAPENAPVALRQFAAQCGTTAYPTLRDAIIHNQRSDKYGQTIKLLRNVTETKVVQVGETLIANATDSNVIVDLNGKTVTFEDEGTFQITEKGALTLSGKGKVISKTADGDVVRIFGSQNDVANECVLNVGKDVTLEGEVGIAVYKGYPVETKCLGVNVTVEGTIISHSSFAAYINGSNKTTTGNVPTFSFTGTSKIQADTVAVYAAGYGKWTFAGNVTAGDDALSIKCGDITITGGTYMAKGEFNDPADANGNGTENTGAAVSITTNSAYAPKTNVTITGGTFISENGYAFYEGIAKKADGTLAAEASTAVIAIQGGDFTGNADLTADIAVTTAENKQVVSGGTFSKPVALAYCAPGYIPVVGTEGKYTVDGTAVAAVANTAGDGTYYTGYGSLKDLIDATTDGTEVLIVKPDALGEEIKLLKTATGGNHTVTGATAYEVAETLGGTFKVQDSEIVYAYQLGIADLDVSESGISVTVRLEEDDTAVTRTLEGRKVRVVSDKTVLAEADAIFTDGACVLTVPAAKLPAGNLELTISVAPAAEAETLAE